MKCKSIMQLPARLPARWLVGARRLFIPIALAFLAYSAYRASGSLAPLVAGISLPHILVACLCWGTAQWVGPFATAAFARILGLPLGYRELALISVLRLPAKYLPGGIWQSVARFSAYRAHAVRNADSLTILVAEHLIALGVSVTMGAGLLLCIENTAAVDHIAAWVLGIGVALLILPTIWIVRSQPARAKTLFWMALVVISAVLFWCLAAAAFYAYWTALFDLHGTDLLRIVSCYLLSWAAGFVAFFAPQGLGVFEWVAARLLPSMQTLSVTVTVVAGFRLVTITGDLAAWMIGVVIGRARQNRAR